MSSSTLAPPPPPRGLDPRDIITEEKFRIAPELLGRPLARPWRRGAAMAIDGLCIAVLANAPGVLLGLAAALVLLRATPRSASTGYVRRSLRLVLRSAGALVLFVVVVILWGDAARMLSPQGLRSLVVRYDTDSDSSGVRVVRQGQGGAARGIATGISAATSAAAMSTAETPEQARAAATRLADAMARLGTSEAEIAEGLREAASESDKPWMAAVMDSVIRARVPAGAAAPLPADSLAVRYAAALAGGDSAAAASLRPELVGALAADTLRAAREEIRELRAEKGRLEGRLEAARTETHLLAYLRGIADDLGLGFGWGALYFTTALAMWRGRTPGKKVMKTRVIRLDGKPIGWWAAFERFGGYAAGLATGLLGFAQIYWDRNRQAVQDKISETVVVFER